MKKIIGVFAMINVCVGIMAVPAMAATTSSAVAVPESLRVGYEQTIIQKMSGRAGSGTIEGAKGIAHEIMFADKMNAKDLLTKGTKTSLTKSSIAKQVDVITTKAGKVAARYQLKDAPSSVEKVLRQVKSGKYQQVQMVGTTETAEAFNAKAVANGITKTMKDSGISTKETARIAEKAVKGISSPSNIAKVANKAAKGGALVGGGIALAESVYRKDDVSDTTGHVAMGTVTGAAAGGVGTVAGEVAAAGLATAGVAGTTSVILPAAVVVGAGVGTAVVIDKVNEKYDIEGHISETVDDINEKYEIDEKVKSTVSDVNEKINDKITEIKEIQ